MSSLGLRAMDLRISPIAPPPACLPIAGFETPPAHGERRYGNAVGHLEVIEDQGAALESGAAHGSVERERRSRLRVRTQRIQLALREDDGRAIPRARMDEHGPSGVLECPARNGRLVGGTGDHGKAMAIAVRDRDRLSILVHRDEL